MAETPAAGSALAGIAWMLLCGLCFVGVQAGVKAVGPEVPATESAFLRYALGIPLILPLLGRVCAAQLRPADWRMFVLRGFLQALGVICWFYAMTRIPLADVTAMNYMAPVYVTLGAALFLGERLAARRLAAIGVAFLGTLIILRPGVRVVDPGHLAMLVTGLSFGGSYLMAKALSVRFSAEVIVVLLSVIVPLWMAPFALTGWVMPELPALGLLLLVAAFATGGHYAMTRAFRAAPVSVTQPVAFLQLVWAVLLGMVFFHEPPDPWVLLGGSLIVGAISFMAWREARLARRITPPDLAAQDGTPD